MEENAEDLPDLKPQEKEFVRLLMFDTSVNGDATEAYRQAFPDSKAKKESMWVLACELKKSDRVQQWIKALRVAGMDSLLMSKEKYLAEVQALIAECKQSGNYGAAANLMKAYGQCAGYYVERKEIMHTRKDEITVLMALIDPDKPHTIEFALGEAKTLGLEHKLVQSLEDKGLYVPEDIS